MREFSLCTSLETDEIEEADSGMLISDSELKSGPSLESEMRDMEDACPRLPELDLSTLGKMGVDLALELAVEIQRLLCKEVSSARVGFRLLSHSPSLELSKYLRSMSSRLSSIGSTEIVPKTNTNKNFT